MKTYIRNSRAYRIYSFLRSFVSWSTQNFPAPSPHFIKQACLIRNGIPNATWVETGTYLGQTTQILSGLATKVYSIEPEPTLCQEAKIYFRDFSNVDILLGTSEDVFPTLLPTLNGDINFWLDGHYSAGPTFKGPQDTPILDELKHIALNMHQFGKLCVLVDDVRCFAPYQPEFSNYPSVDVLVDWARTNHLHWHIEQDIFIAKNYIEP